MLLTYSVGIRTANVNHRITSYLGGRQL